MTQPIWLTEARKWLGTKEVPGAGNSPVIMGWVRKLGANVLGITVNDDATPWCGTFMAFVMQECGISPPPIAVRASSWGKWGRELTLPRLGCILVFTRAGGGHVGQYAGERADAYRVVGANQSDAVTETWIAKNRLAPGGMRWPNGQPLPAAQRVMLANDGRPVSSNEA